MEDAMHYFLALHNQVKLLHWTATSYGTHKALDDLHTDLAPLIDRFIEMYIGHFKKQPFRPFKLKIELSVDVAKVIKFLEKHRDALTAMTQTYTDAPGFENVLAEMVSLFDNAIYLCNLK
jgi:hypothetical protein